MTKQVIGIGTTANDGTGDTPRVAFDKVNDNFNELYATRWIISADAPTETDVIWIDSPAIAGVYDVKKYIDSGWRQIGWYSIDGVFSTKPPITLVMAGQSNSIGSGGADGDVAQQAGIICWSSGDTITVIADDVPDTWARANYLLSPFNGNNNTGIQLAKRAIELGVADIVRILVNSEGGLSIDSWIGSVGSPIMFTRLEAILTNSGVPRIDWFLWQQGETGGPTADGSGGYRVDLAAFLVDLRALPTWDVTSTKFVACGHGSATNGSTTCSEVSTEGALRLLATDSDPLTGYVPSWDCALLDGIHFTGAGHTTLSVRAIGEFMRLPHPITNTDDWSFDLTTVTNYISRMTASNGSLVSKNIAGQFLGLTNGTTPIFSVNGANGKFVFGNFQSADLTFSDYVFQGRVGLNYGGNLYATSNFNLAADTGNLSNLNTVLVNYSSEQGVPAAGLAEATLVGRDAGKTTANVSNCTMIGSAAGFGANVAGEGALVVMVGRYAGISSVGYKTCYVGASAGNDQRGSYCTSIGYAAGAVDTSTYDNSTAIGANAKVTKSNQFVFGDNAIVEHWHNGTTTSVLIHSGDRLRLTTQKTPASATATGTAGDICHDASYIYVCTATDTWKRVAIATW